MPSTCKFVFDRTNRVYYSGETINGHITLRTTKEKTIRGVYIVFEGAAKVRWDVRRPSYGKSEYSTEHFNANKNYVNTRTCVFRDSTLPPGTHKYTFSIPLPSQCPTSCTEKYGKISYEITLKIERPLRFANEFTKLLSVIKQLNLNSSPEYLIPIKGEDIKYFCFWPCSSGPVISTLTIPFSGWAPGQKIPYMLEVVNQSTRYDLNGTWLKLLQKYSFTAYSPRHKTCTHENILARFEKGDRTDLRLSKRIFEGILRIPPVPPSSMASGIITVSYRIGMTIHMGDCHKDSEIWIPITIGTIPLAQSATSLDNIIALPQTARSSATPPPAYESCVPPTFEEATHIGEKFKDTDKNYYQAHSTDDWIPKYPMYNNFLVPAAASECDVMEIRTLSGDLNTNVMPPSDSQRPYSTSNPEYPFSTAGRFVVMPSLPGS